MGQIDGCRLNTAKVARETRKFTGNNADVSTQMRCGQAGKAGNTVVQKTDAQIQTLVDEL